MKSLVNGEDADKAYAAFLEFKDVVKANQVATAGAPAAAVPTGDKIGQAAEKLSAASYPFLKSVDWLSPIYLKPLPGVSAKESLKAISSIDASGVPSAADYAAVNNALGHAVASVPTSKGMDVYNAFKGIVPSSIPNNLFSLADPLAAAGAAKAFYDFKDVVKAAQ